MAIIHIPDNLDRSLQQMADRQGQTKEDFIEETLSFYLDERNAKPIELSDRQIERMRHSIAQLDAGEGVTMEETQAFFDDWTAELESREFSSKAPETAVLKTR